MSLRNLFLAVPGAACAVAVYFILFDSLDPAKYYRGPGTSPSGFSHPTSLLRVVVFITVAEAAFLYFLLQPWRPQLRLRRLALGFLAFVLWGLVSVLGALGHPPVFIKDHALWVLFVTVFLGVVLGIAGARRLWYGARRVGAA